MAGRFSEWFARRPHTVEERRGVPLDLSPALVDYIQAVNTVDDVGDPRYRAAAEALRKDPGGNARDAARLEAQAPTSETGLRTSAVMALAAIGDPHAVKALRDIIARPLETADRPSERTAAEAQLGVQLQAIEGLAGLAIDDVDGARDALVESAVSTTRAVQGLALAWIAELPDGQEVLQDLAARLPDDRRGLAGLRRVSLTDVGQIEDPQSTLIAVSAITTDGAPRLVEDGGDQDAIEPRTDTPRIKSEVDHG